MRHSHQVEVLRIEVSGEGRSQLVDAAVGHEEDRVTYCARRPPAPEETLGPRPRPSLHLAHNPNFASWLTSPPRDLEGPSTCTGHWMCMNYSNARALWLEVLRTEGVALARATRLDEEGTEGRREGGCPLQPPRDGIEHGHSLRFVQALAIAYGSCARRRRQSAGATTNQCRLADICTRTSGSSSPAPSCLSSRNS
eukprot:5266433-Prymnesium_polylepis.1